MPDAPVRIVAPDPAWRNSFQEWAPRVAELLGSELAGPVEHIGSTSVPGLPAKPVVDMLAPVRSLERARELVPRLADGGWLLWPDDPNSGYRLWFLRPTPEARTHHLQVIEAGDEHATALLRFRDALRASPELRQAYGDLKTELAERYRHDRNGYTDAKARFVQDALRS